MVVPPLKGLLGAASHYHKLFFMQNRREISLFQQDYLGCFKYSRNIGRWHSMNNICLQLLEEIPIPIT